MSTEAHAPSRREFLQTTGGVAAAAAVPFAYPQGSDLIQVALVGCGSRGTSAARNAMATKSGPISLVAMADAFEDRLKQSAANLGKAIGAQMDVPDDRRFVGWDAYRQAMDALRPGDIVILATPPAFRWVHFEYAITKRLNVFMEKPVTVDGPTSRRMLMLADEASQANLKVGVGLMSRHTRSLQELHERVENGELGEIVLMRGYRMHAPAGSAMSPPKPAAMSDLDYQVRRFHSFLWASGGLFSDFYIHHIDHLCWMKNGWPVKAQALGGRHYRQNDKGVAFVDQNFDTYAVEYTFADGAKFYFDGRCMTGGHGIYSSYVHGTRGVAIAARRNDYIGPSSIHRGQNPTPESRLWESSESGNPYQDEWDVLVSAIRNDTPHNEVVRGVEASLVTSMGRMAAHTGQEITYEEMLNCEHEFAPDVGALTAASPAPLPPDADGRYAVPRPGQIGKREY
jgi:predicted dehydrogenase